MRRLMIVLLLLASCKERTKIAPPDVSFPVRSAVAEKREAPIFIDALGHVDPIISIDIRSRIEGELTGVYFEQGKEVKEGDLLFTIDPRPYQATLKGAQATLEQNRVNLALAEEKVKRYRTLAQDEYYSQIDYETLQTNYAATAAVVQQNEAQVERAANDLDYCWIYAPIHGLTGLLQIDFGNLVSADGVTPLVTLKQIAPIFVTFSIPEFKLHELQKYQRQKGLKVLAAFDDFSKESYEGELQVIDNSVDTATGMIKLRAVFANEGRELWPGQFIRTRVLLYTIPDAVIVPYSAVQYTQSGPVAFVILKDNTVEKRDVKLGQREDDFVIVLEGIAAGERIVTEGQINLDSGVTVHEPL
ncbi:MAG: efflux RND transporter periplasmic adaptor subunit [Verrucomicrobia bacterium]|nr:efflux RND transporter periplasmic adaptor subunit [Verrucomicrobiota bacterium]